MRAHAALMLLTWTAASALATDRLVPGQYATIQSAIDASVDGDAVVVSAGTYNENLDLLGKLITVRSVSGAASTIVDGGAAGSVVRVVSSETPAGTLVEGFTFRNGNAAQGGGMYVGPSAGLTVRACVFTQNFASSQGGGAHFQQVAFDVLVEGCTFDDNEAPAGAGCTIVSSFATVRGCNFTANRANAAGGGVGAGMLITASSRVGVEDCVFDGNVFQSSFGNGGRGGGLAVDQAYPTIVGCEFRNHNAFKGGGVGGEGGGVWISTAPGQPPRAYVLRDCVFEDNVAGTQGGGLAALRSESTISGCRFVNNRTSDTTGGGGGGAYIFADSAIVTGCEFIDNSGAYGGGLSMGGPATLTLANSLFAGNSAVAPFGEGGAVRLHFTSTTIVNTTLVGNTTVNGADGAISGSFPGGVANAYNVVAWGNAPAHFATQFGNTLNVSHSIVQGGYAGTANTSADPLFVDPDGPDDDAGTYADNDYRLAPGSPGIDSGDSTRVPTDSRDADGDNDFTERLSQDAAGGARFVDDPGAADTGVPDSSGLHVDRGAFEFQVDACPPDLTGEGDVNTNDFFLFLSLYQAMDPRSDFSPGGGINTNDFFGFLSAYQAGC